MDDDEYRAFLSGWGVESSKDLTPRQSAEVVAALRKLAGQEHGRAGARRSRRNLRYDDLGHRPGMASPKQLRMLEAMWMDVTRQATRESALEAYCTWLLNRFRVGRPEWIADVQVGKIKMALEQMQVKEST
ncbi:MAG: regulatory protein GemA, partial [Chlorobiales bacterium]|nr:regulatory protein GemA [Chlorobiales bacterium]